MSSFIYLLTPFLAWLLTGVLKFLINSIKERRFAFELIGYGGLPSNHSAIVSSMVTLIALKEGMNTPAFGVAITLAFIVILDAKSLRSQVGRQAAAINKLNQADKGGILFLRERIGHTPIEIISGIAVGIAVGFFMGITSQG